MLRNKTARRFPASFLQSGNLNLLRDEHVPLRLIVKIVEQQEWRAWNERATV